MWGPFTVDNFASNLNTQLTTFHSRCWCPGTCAVDTFTVFWRTEINWLVPPVHWWAEPFVMRECVVPKESGLESAVFWLVIVPDGSHFAGFIHAWFSFPYYQRMIIRGPSSHSIASAMNTESLFIALYFDLSVADGVPFQHPGFKFY